MMMTLNPETENTTLNIKLKTNDGFERQYGNATLNVKLRSDNGFERQD